jgi:thiamine transport system substrate-binding protein
MTFAVSEAVLDAFQQESGITVRTQTGDAGAMVNQSILTRIIRSVMSAFGVDNTFLGRALDADIFGATTTHRLPKSRRICLIWKIMSPG